MHTNGDRRVVFAAFLALTLGAVLWVISSMLGEPAPVASSAPHAATSAAKSDTPSGAPPTLPTKATPLAKAFEVKPLEVNAIVGHGQFRGTVFHPNDTPAPGATVWVISTTMPRDFQKVITQEDGTFVVENLRKPTYDLCAAFGDECAVVFAIETGTETAVHLEPMDRVTFYVKNEYDEPVNDFTLGLEMPAEGNNPMVAPEMQPRIISGPFRETVGTQTYLLGAPGRYKVTAVTREGASGSELFDFRPPTCKDEITVHVFSGAEFSGVVVDRAGAPIPGAEVSIQSNWNDDRPMMQDLPQPTMGANGTFKVEHLPQGPYQVWAKAPGYAATSTPAEFDMGSKPIRDHKIVLQLVGTIHGVYREDGAPIAGVRIYATGTANLFDEQPETAADGTFTIHDVPPGHYEVRATQYDDVTDTHRTQKAFADVSEGNTTEVNFDRGGVDVSGIVDGVPGRMTVVVSLIPAGRKPDHDSDGSVARVQFRGSGPYLLDHVPAGQYTLKATATPLMGMRSGPEEPDPEAVDAILEATQEITMGGSPLQVNLTVQQTIDLRAPAAETDTGP